MELDVLAVEPMRPGIEGDGGGREPWAVTRVMMVADLAEHGQQASWDWEADRRWARMKGDREMVGCLDHLLANTGVAVQRVNYHDAYIRQRVTLPRLKALRRLVRDGECVSYWMGAGEGSRASYGVGRIRVYRLNPERFRS